MAPYSSLPFWYGPSGTGAVAPTKSISRILPRYHMKTKERMFRDALWVLSRSRIAMVGNPVVIMVFATLYLCCAFSLIKSPFRAPKNKKEHNIASFFFSGAVCCFGRVQACVSTQVWDISLRCVSGFHSVDAVLISAIFLFLRFGSVVASSLSVYCCCCCCCLLFLHLQHMPL